MAKLKILIVDDHEVIHSGINSMLQSEKNLKVIGDAYSGEEAVTMAMELEPEIIFMDISMPGMSGIEATRIISKKMPQVKIIALTQNYENEYVMEMMNAGGAGYLLKNSKKEEIITAIELVKKDQLYVSSELSQNLLSQVFEKKSEEEEDAPIHLTKREIEVIQKIAEDKSNNEIADECNISLRTVETHRRNIMQKLNAKSVVSVVKYAVKNDLINL